VDGGFGHNRQELRTAATVCSVSGCSVFCGSGTVLFWGQITAREEITSRLVL